MCGPLRKGVTDIRVYLFLTGIFCLLAPQLIGQNDWRRRSCRTLEAIPFLVEVINSLIFLPLQTYEKEIEFPFL